MEQTTQLSNLSVVADNPDYYIGDPWAWPKPQPYIVPSVTVITTSQPHVKTLLDFTTTELIAELKRRKAESEELEGITFAST